MTTITAAVLLGLSVLLIALAALAIWQDIKNDPPYTQWWDKEEERRDFD